MKITLGMPKTSWSYQVTGIAVMSQPSVMHLIPKDNWWFLGAVIAYLIIDGFAYLCVMRLEQRISNRVIDARRRELNEAWWAKIGQQFDEMRTRWLLEEHYREQRRRDADGEGWKR